VRELAATLLGRRASASDPTDAIVNSASVRSALATLPPRQRAVIALCELEGLSTAETAAALAIREATVRWHMQQAKQRLATILGDTR
jgi:RNA polymerase sigma-70 factor (ECF subfamily)